MKTGNRKHSHKQLSLGDLVAVIGSYARNDREMVAAVADLLGRGRVLVRSHGQYRKARVVH